MTDTTTETVKAGELFSFAKKHGSLNAIKNTGAELLMKDGKKFPFGKATGIAIGASFAAHAALASKTTDGEDRSAIARLTEAVFGVGLAAGSALAGRAL